MKALRDLVPAEEHYGHEGRFHEECDDTFYGKRCSEYVADEVRIVAPVRTELELEDDARSHAHGKVNAKEALPILCCLLPELLSGPEVQGLHDAHHYG